MNGCVARDCKLRKSQLQTKPLSKPSSSMNSSRLVEVSRVKIVNLKKAGLVKVAGKCRSTTLPATMQRILTLPSSKRFRLGRIVSFAGRKKRSSTLSMPSERL